MDGAARPGGVTRRPVTVRPPPLCRDRAALFAVAHPIVIAV
ncbi:hypothetical protein BV133_2509 [Blastochloris viridis]|uniref:Uncharacterized protein n=1 Tax=Blastochloris viridis TaxID=1079 RepID=A0A182D5P4_BLAVI|nr:hypothetical protein BV133_2509 [Blastochloris viridis]